MYNNFLKVQTQDKTETYYILKELIEDVRIETRGAHTADVFIDTPDREYYMGCFTSIENAELYVERMLSE